MGIKVEHVSFTYNKKASNSTLALNDVSLSINVQSTPDAHRSVRPTS